MMLNEGRFEAGKKAALWKNTSIPRRIGSVLFTVAASAVADIVLIPIAAIAVVFLLFFSPRDILTVSGFILHVPEQILFETLELFEVKPEDEDRAMRKIGLE